MSIKFLGIVFLVLSGSYANAQQVIFSTKTGQISFFSKAPLDDIDAINKKAISLMNAGNNEIVVRVPINQFEFPNKLMQQHFNENYLESEKYTHATFIGRINETLDFSKNAVYDVSATGVLNIHGVDQKRTLIGKLLITPAGLELQTKFDVQLADHKIRIPKLVFNKIAEKIEVSIKFNYTPYKK